MCILLNVYLDTCLSSNFKHFPFKISSSNQAAVRGLRTE